MDITEEGSSTPNVVGRGRGLLCSPLRLRYDTPVSGRGFVRGDSQGIPGPQSSEGVVVPPLAMCHTRLRTTVHLLLTQILLPRRL